MGSSNRSGCAKAESLFDQLAAALRDMPDVTLGRRYGCPCIKFRGHPFIALDGDRIAFRIGAAASVLLAQFPQARLWNPRNGRLPKQSWISHPEGDPEPMAALGAMAYERAANASPVCAA
jgi:hypothetical protein